jgi:hypothetical protein
MFSDNAAAKNAILAIHWASCATSTDTSLHSWLV